VILDVPLLADQTEIREGYAHYRTQDTDVRGHMAIFRAYAGGCDSILECGVRGAVSTWAFLRGLLDHGGGVMHCCDITKSPEAEAIEDVAQQAGIEFHFHEQNDLTLDIGPVDLIFLDTWHVYGHLKRELDKFGPLARKWILIHDTTVDAEVGESIRMNYDIDAQMKESGYTAKEITKGIWPAVEDFLAEHPEWEIEARYSHCNGLTVLGRNV